MKTYRCPHCLTIFPYSEVWFQCLQPNDKSRKAHEKYKAKVEDVISGISKRFPKNFAERYAKLPEINTISYEDDDGNDIRNQYYSSIVDNYIFKACRRTVGRQYNENEIPMVATCPYCNGKHKVDTHVCPNPACNRALNINPNEHQYIINLAGGISNGRSLFLGALLYSIDRYLPHVTTWNVTLDENAKRYKKSFVFRMMHGDKKLHHAAYFDLSKRVASVSLIKGNQEKYTFIFYNVYDNLFDITDDAQLFKSAKQFLDPDFIIMACDPSNFEEIRKAVLDNKEINESIKKSFVDNCPLKIQTDNHKFAKTDVDNSNPFDLMLIDTLFEVETPYANIPTPAQILSRIISFMRILDTVNADYTGKPSGKRNVPFAFCLTKSDLIKEAYADNEKISKILEPSTLTSGNLCDLSYKKYAVNFKEKSNELKSVLAETWFERALVGEIESTFPDSYYCAVSAKGYNADCIPREDYITPAGVLDPFVWILNSVNPQFFNLKGSSDSTDADSYSAVNTEEAF